MKTLFRASVLGLLVSATLIGLSACNRLNSVPGDIGTSSQDTTLYFEVTTSSNYVEPGSTITLNVIAYQRKNSEAQLTRLPESSIESADISWSADDGQFMPNKGYQVSFTAPSTSGNVSVYAGLNKGNKYTELGELELPGRVTINVVSTLAPAAPRGLIAVATDNAISLTWTPNTERYLGGYYVYYGVNSGADGAVLLPNRVTVNATANSVTINNLENNTNYNFAVRAFSNGSIVRESIRSNVVLKSPLDSTAPDQPISFQATQIGTQNKVMLSWRNPSNVDFRGVRIIRTSGDLDPISPTDRDAVLVYEGVNAQFADEMGLLVGGAYTYTIYSFDDEVVRNYSGATSIRINLTNSVSH